MNLKKKLQNIIKRTINLFHIQDDSLIETEFFFQCRATSRKGKNFYKNKK